MSYKNSTEQMSVIIVGASGFLGSRLYRYYTDHGANVLGTYYASKRNGLLHFDLSRSSLDQLGISLTNVTHAILCADILPMDLSKTNKREANEINEGIKKLIQDLLDRNITPLLVSTDYVFDGSKGDYKEEERTKPVLEYGKRKMEIEAFLMQRDQSTAIARLSHVYSLDFDDKTFLTQIASQLINEETVCCATDQVFSPTYVGDAVRAIDQVIQKGLVGCYHIAPPEHFSRYEIASMVKEGLEIPSGGVEACSIGDFDFPDNRPLNTSLNVEKFLNATGFEFTSLRESILRLKAILAL